MQGRKCLVSKAICCWNCAQPIIQENSVLFVIKRLMPSCSILKITNSRIVKPFIRKCLFCLKARRWKIFCCGNETFEINHFNSIAIPSGCRQRSEIFAIWGCISQSIQSISISSMTCNFHLSHNLFHLNVACKKICHKQLSTALDFNSVSAENCHQIKFIQKTLSYWKQPHDS